MVGAAGAHLALPSGERVVQCEIQHASQRVRAVGRRSAARHYVHAAHEALREDIQVDGPGDAAVGLGLNHTRTVEQDQHALGIQAAQVRKCAAVAGVGRGSKARGGGGIGSPELRQLVDRIRKACGRRQLHLFCSEHRDRGGRGEAVRNDARTRNNDLLELGIRPIQPPGRRLRSFPAARPVLRHAKHANPMNLIAMNSNPQVCFSPGAIGA